MKGGEKMPLFLSPEKGKRGRRGRGMVINPLKGAKLSAKLPIGELPDNCPLSP